MEYFIVNNLETGAGSYLNKATLKGEVLFSYQQCMNLYGKLLQFRALQFYYKRKFSTFSPKPKLS